MTPQRFLPKDIVFGISCQPAWNGFHCFGTYRIKNVKFDTSGITYYGEHFNGGSKLSHVFRHQQEFVEFIKNYEIPMVTPEIPNRELVHPDLSGFEQQPRFKVGEQVFGISSWEPLARAELGGLQVIGRFIIDRIEYWHKTGFEYYSNDGKDVVMVKHVFANKDELLAFLSEHKFSDFTK